MARSKRPNPQSMQSKKPSVQSRRPLLYYGGVALALLLVAFAVYGLMIPKRSVDSSSGLIASTPAPANSSSDSTTSAPAPAEARLGLPATDAPAPDMTFTAVDGTQRHLSEFRGHPVMLWFLATWCTSCQAGATAFAQKSDQLQASGLQVILLELYNNLGYPGPTIEQFVQRYGGPAASTWQAGEASQEGSYAYDPKGYPDIYYLIDKDGIVRVINGAPSATMDQITSFARGVH